MTCEMCGQRMTQVGPPYRQSGYITQLHRCESCGWETASLRPGREKDDPRQVRPDKKRTAKPI